MHIPDGYLSPATCVAAYVVTLPFWYLALKKVDRQLNSRMVPLLAVFSAFSFVIMMFNLPLPGGTTGHAVGLGIAAVVLGPWAGMLAISIALLIQAVFFGDGGISTLAANCLNMGVVGVGVAYAVYRLAAGRAPLDAPRRVFAAGLAGYLGLNAAALLTAVEFGVQPLWFHDADGTPLYAPYPLAIAVPAMMIGHLGIAGIAEAVVSAGLLSYLQRSDPGLLRLSAPAAAAAGPVAVPEPVLAATGWSGARRLWAILALLMVFTPLGLVATGVAWGEWGSEDFGDPAMRQEIALASADQAPPAEAPRGLASLATLWRSPIPDYEVPFLPSGAGYVLSAMLGTGLVILLWLVAAWLVGRARGQPVRS
ncbi:cobalt transporter CbiM [Parasulfuritortus cantonensis]|uniref:Cobalt transporter CbiM n=1 Tax=Parasulfuritortus cantonensis TaxID=2528202 RepID=A0A4R1BN61_9PROT|nr:cobalt transporter CbiM [Parasulfuritortus cantonensis]TCJ18919.1 cobalt transporter CbiM [Parasulfuritortus cantonensis]